MLDKLKKIYDMEINFQISSFWDNGYVAKLGDPTNGIIEIEIFNTIEDAIKFLYDEAVKYEKK
jgi:hypothetical protein